MARNAQQIREEIEQTRGQLGQTLEAIGDRVSPRHVVEDLAEKVSPRRLVRRQTERMKEGISNVGDTMKSKANNGVNGSRSDRASLPKPSAQTKLPKAGLPKPALPKPSLPSVDVPRVEAKAKQKASAIKGEVTERAQGVSGRVREVSATAVEQVRTAPENAPLIAGAVAFGAGLAVALAVRPSSKERKVAASVGNGVAPPLRARATRVKENVRAELEPKVKGGLDRVKRSAAGAKARVKAEATGATTDVKTDIAEVADEVKKGTRNVKSATRAEVKRKVAAKQSSRRTSSPKKSSPRATSTRTSSPKGSAGVGRARTGPGRRAVATNRPTGRPSAAVAGAPTTPA